MSSTSPVVTITAASRVFGAYADAGGKTEQLCRELVAAGKQV